MNKNIKSIFFVLTLITLLIAVGAVSAADDSNSTSAVDNSVSDVTLSYNNAVAAEPVTTSNDKQVDTKTIKKEEKQIKKDSVTIDGRTYTNVIENKSFNGDFYMNPTFINNCTMNGDTAFFEKTSYINNSICNAMIFAEEVIYINNSVINGEIMFGSQSYVYNSTINGDLYNTGTLIIDDNTVINPNVNVDNTGSVLSNNTSLLYTVGEFNLEDGILSDMSIDKPITNNGQLTLNNVTLDSMIKNNNKLIISDDCTITDNFRLSGDGEVITNLTIPDDVYNSSKVIEVNNFNELNSAIVNAGNDQYYDYIINLNDGTYQFNKRLYDTNNIRYRSNVIINGNNQTLNANNDVTFTNGYNIIFNQLNLNVPLRIGGTGTASSNPLTTLTLNQTTVLKNINVLPNGKLIISDDTVFDSNANLTSTGTLVTNNTNLLYPYKNSFEGGSLKDITIDKDITVNGNFTLKNVTVDKTITNNGRLIIDDDVIFTENGQIAGIGEIVTNNITKILPYIQTINGNYTITDITLNKTYNFDGNITLDNCNITSTDNINYGILNIKNSNIIAEDETTWITNNGLLVIDNSNTSGNITNNRELYIDNLPEDYTYDNTYHVINNATAPLYFDTTTGNTLNDKIQEGDTLDFQGTISGIPNLGSLVINKPVNIITSTNDGRIENFSSITYNNGASGSNITGLYTYNTQFYVRNAHNMVFDNISNVVISKGIGWGVGQTSIRENSTNITVKNSYFYTKDNGGSSTFVFGWADNCTLVNSTVEADGTVGNLIYLTTYNVDVPSGTIANCNNQILNNIIIGPETPAAICWGIVLSGANNNIANNRIYYKGNGIVNQWGSGITGEGVDSNETSLVTIENNTLTNNTHIKHKPTNELIIDTTTFTPGETTTITATIRFTMQKLTDINKGKVTFKVDGKTLKDTTGKVIYAKIINGTATIENYTVPDTWKEGSTIQAIYSGSTQCEKLNSEKTEITINKEAPTFTIDPIEPATIGDTITLKATITDNNKQINTGKVVFKINGKTVKDENGKVIYAKVINGQVSVNYTIPDSYKRGNYTLTATYIGTDYDKLTSESTINVVNP